MARCVSKTQLKLFDSKALCLGHQLQTYVKKDVSLVVDSRDVSLEAYLLHVRR